MQNIETFRQSLKRQWEQEQEQEDFKSDKRAAMGMGAIGAVIGIGLACLPSAPIAIAGGVIAIACGRFAGRNAECLRQGREIEEE